MTRRKPKSIATRRLEIRVGDYVLIGGGRASYPGSWPYALVLWTEGDHVLVRRIVTSTGESFPAVEHITSIRAVGSMEKLLEIRRDAVQSVRALRKNVEEAEQALGKARERLFAKLDVLNGVIPPDFDAMDAAAAEDRARYHGAIEEMEKGRDADFGRIAP